MEGEKESWHPEGIAEQAEGTLLGLHRASVLQNFYLAGGTGLALQLGHRRSVDLDFFSGQPFNEDDLLAKIQVIDGISQVEKERQSIFATVGDTKVSFLVYQYPMIFSVRIFRDVEVADHRDIACMKVSAIMSRGKKRDFIDLYTVSKSYGLKYVLRLFEEKFEKAHFNPEFVLKSLTYFEDAEEDPMPEMLMPVSWEEVKAFFRREAPALR